MEAHVAAGAKAGGSHGGPELSVAPVSGEPMAGDGSMPPPEEPVASSASAFTRTRLDVLADVRTFDGRGAVVELSDGRGAMVELSALPVQMSLWSGA